MKHDISLQGRNSIHNISSWEKPLGYIKKEDLKKMVKNVGFNT